MEKTQKVIFLGDSEVGVVDRMKETLSRKYNIDLIISCNPGAQMLALGQRLAQLLKKKGPADQIFVFGLTCSLWKKTSLTPEDKSLQVITWNSACNLSYVPVQMDAITRTAVHFNPAVRVYLVLPTMKDIATFNEAFLRRQGREDLIPALEQHPQLQRTFLNIKAREVFGQTVDIKSDNKYWWSKKQIFSMKTVFDRYYNEKEQENPHHQFWMGRSDRLNAQELCYDGLHYTESAFDEMFAILSPTNFKRRTQESRPVTTVTTPTTTTTTSVIVEEVESVPGPSGIQSRIEYRPSQPQTGTTPKKRRTKGQSETRVYYSRAFRDSMNLGEQPSTSTETNAGSEEIKIDQKKGSFKGGPLKASKAKKSSGTKPQKSKVKRLQSSANRRRKIQRRIERKTRQQEKTTQSAYTNPSTLTPAVLTEFSVFSAVHSTQIWKFAKERGFSKEVALQEFSKVFKQVSEMDPQ